MLLEERVSFTTILCEKRKEVNKKAAMLILLNFLYNTKVGNAHSKWLAYPGFACIQTMQNGKADFALFPIVQESVRKHTPRAVILSTQNCEVQY